MSAEKDAIERIFAIEASLKLDSAIWDDYERQLSELNRTLSSVCARLTALERSDSVNNQRLNDLENFTAGKAEMLEALRERPTYAEIRAALEADDSIEVLHNLEHATSRGVATPTLSAGQREALGLPVAKAPDEPPATCECGGTECFGDVDDYGKPFIHHVRKEQPSCGTLSDAASLSSRSSATSHSTGGATTERAEGSDPCPKNQSPSVASADDSDRNTASGLPATACGGSESKSATSTAPSSAAELRDALQAYGAERVGVHRRGCHRKEGRAIDAADVLAAAASRAVEEIADLTLEVERMRRGRGNATATRNMAEAERDEAVRLLRRVCCTMGDEGCSLASRAGYLMSLDMRDIRAFLARHPDAAQGGGD